MKSIKEILEPFILEKDGAKINHLYSHNAEYLIKQLEENQREFGRELLENVIKNVTTKCLNQDVTGSSCCSECEYHIVNKESITSTLDDYLLNNKI